MTATESGTWWWRETTPQDAGDWLRVDVGSVSGSPGHVNLCLTITQ